MEMIFVSSSLLEVDKFLDFFPSLSQKKICETTKKKSDEKNEHVVYSTYYMYERMCQINTNISIFFFLLLKSDGKTEIPSSRPPVAKIGAQFWGLSSS